jgi:two-component system NarL family sensor kinase
MELEQSPVTPIRRLELLREIAETINGAYEMEPMLSDVLQKLLQLTGLQAGWVFLSKPGSADYRCAADCGLPPALEYDGKRPMREGSCWCLDRFWDGRLRHAVNILNCKRLEDAVRCKWGNTRGISHHASIPLRSGKELFGILNVASPGKTHFSGEELELLQSIAYQIGTAAHRIRLYQTEQKRANLYARLGQVTRHIGKLLDSRSLAAGIVSEAGERMGWPGVALFVKEAHGLSRRALYQNGHLDERAAALPEKRAGMLVASLAEGRTVLWRDMEQETGFPGGKWHSGAAVPLVLQGESFGVLAAGSPKSGELDAIDAEVLEALAAHVALTYDNVFLHENRRELARWEERNRIARDLHDSVSQMLFSMSLHAKGLAQALPYASEAAKQALSEVQRLSQAAAGEMRAMIRQLRPKGLEEGLLTGLQRYGESIGVRVTYTADELRQLPERLEDALWRIGQEALNNVRKHARCDTAHIALSFTEWEVSMTVSDHGAGMTKRKAAAASGYGMTTMRERTEALGGTLTVTSRVGQGTRVTVRLPL